MTDGPRETPALAGATAVVCLGDPSFRAAAVAGLERLGVSPITEALGPTEALAAVRRTCPDVLVMDLSLTGMGGWTYLQGLATSHPYCRVVVVSPLGTVPLAALEVGAVAVLAEGDIAGLRAVVREVLAGAQRPASGPEGTPAGPTGEVGSRSWKAPPS